MTTQCAECGATWDDCWLDARLRCPACRARAESASPVKRIAALKRALGDLIDACLVSLGPTMGYDTKAPLYAEVDKARAVLAGEEP